ncbi:NUDIX domain-containing protein [Paenibacillus tarimensis]
MEIRQMTAAYLLRGKQLLMIRKSKSRHHQAPFWSGLGGHLEPEEINAPKQGCLREIHEESGIQPSEISDLTLKYILLRIKGDEIRQQFVYFGRTDREHLVPSEEGELHWIDRERLFDLNMSAINTFMLKHYFSHPAQEEVLVGTITMNDGEEPVMQWATLKDPLKF